MSSPLLVSTPDYFKQPHEAQRFADFCATQHAQGEPLGLWEFARHEAISPVERQAVLSDQQTRSLLRAMRATRARTGLETIPERLALGSDEFWINPKRGHVEVSRLLSRAWSKNVVTDNGATAMLKNTWNNTGSAVGIFNQIAIDTAAGSTTLTTALTNGQTGVTSLAVAALPGAIVANASIVLGYGTGQTQTVTVTAAGAASGATAIPVTSFTANAAYAIGTNVVPSPATSDNPAALTGTVAYSGALTAGAFTFSGTGAGNRQVVISYTFATTTTAGNYNEAWTVNTNPVALAGQTANHLIGVAQPINSTTSLTISITEKL